MTKKKRTARTRLSRGVFVSLCLVATIVLAVGTGIFSQRALEQQALSDNVGTSLPESVAEVNTVEEFEPEPLEIVNDTEYGAYEKGKALVLVDESSDIEQLNTLLAKSDLVQTKDVSDQDSSIGFVCIELADGVDVGQALKYFEDDGFKAQPNYVYETAAEAQSSDPVSIDDPDASRQWALQSLDMYRAWNILQSKVSDSRSVSVAVIDTGCAMAHEDLVGNIIPAASYNSATKEAGIDKVQDQFGHGTHVAGIACADVNNGLGVAGTSYDARLVVIKASYDSGNKFDTVTLARAYAWLLDNDENGQNNAERYNVRVVNMSVGGPSAIDKNDVLYGKITDAKAAGILTVCAAGNAGNNATPPYGSIPGDYEDCLTVINLETTSGEPNDSSATNAVKRADSSNYNGESETEASKAKNISAPGSKIYSTGHTEATPYREDSGTSMASPAVAGVAAMLFAYEPSLTPQDVQTLLEQTATDLGDAGWDRETGYGEVDAYHAMQVLSAQVSIGDVPYLESVNPSLTCSDGSHPLSSEWTWSSSDSRILSIDEASGKVIACGLGEATITATSKSMPSVQVSQKVKTTLDLSQVEISAIPDQAFNAQKIEPVPTVSYKGITLSRGDHYEIVYSHNDSIGPATLLVVAPTNSPVGEYISNRKEASFVIRMNINDATAIVRPANGDKNWYSGSEIIPSLSVIHNGNTLTSDDYYVIRYENNIEAGIDTAAIIIGGKGAYAGEKRISFSIYGKFNEATVGQVTNPVYTGGELRLEPEVRSTSGRLLEKGTCYDLVYQGDTVNPGKVTVTIVGKNAYEDSSVTRAYTIQTPPKHLSNASVSSLDTTRNLTGKKIDLGVQVYYGNDALQEGRDYYLTYNGSSDFPTSQGTYYVNAVGMGNYSDTRYVGVLRLLRGPDVDSNTQVRISSLANSNYVLDAAGSIPRVGSNISIWTDNGGDNQKWRLVLSDEGYYTIRSAASSDYVLDAAGGIPSLGSNISIWTDNGGDNQKWFIEMSSDGSYYTIKNAANESYVLDAAGGNPRQGANVSVWSSNGGNNQKWSIVSESASFDSSAVYEIRSVSNSSYVLDAAGSTPSIGANVSIWTRNNGSNQKWYLVPDGNGYYTIRSAANSSYILDAAGGTPWRGSNVSIWTDNGGNNQKWKIERLANGSFLIRSAANQDYVLDASGGTPRRGANVSVWSSNGGNNQKWWITAV